MAICVYAVVGDFDIFSHCRGTLGCLSLIGQHMDVCQYGDLVVSTIVGRLEICTIIWGTNALADIWNFVIFVIIERIMEYVLLSGQPMYVPI